MTTNQFADVMYQEMDGIQKRLSDLSRTVGSLSKTVSSAKMEEASTYKNREAFLLEEIARATDTMDKVARALRPYTGKDEVIVVLKKKLPSTLPETMRLADVGVGTEKTNDCPCGDTTHYGILFKTDPPVTRCPKSWWVSLSHLAFSTGTLRAFTEFTPIREFMEEYRK